MQRTVVLASQRLFNRPGQNSYCSFLQHHPFFQAAAHAAPIVATLLAASLYEEMAVAVSS